MARFHVDDLSSAHVYLRLPDGTGLDDIPKDTLEDCCQLVKHNSIQGLWACVLPGRLTGRGILLAGSLTIGHPKWVFGVPWVRWSEARGWDAAYGGLPATQQPRWMRLGQGKAPWAEQGVRVVRTPRQASKMDGQHEICWIGAIQKGFPASGTEERVRRGGGLLPLSQMSWANLCTCTCGLGVGLLVQAITCLAHCLPSTCKLQKRASRVVCCIAAMGTVAVWH